MYGEPLARAQGTTRWSSQHFSHTASREVARPVLVLDIAISACDAQIRLAENRPSLSDQLPRTTTARRHSRVGCAGRPRPAHAIREHGETLLTGTMHRTIAVEVHPTDTAKIPCASLPVWVEYGSTKGKNDTGTQLVDCASGERMEAASPVAGATAGPPKRDAAQAAKDKEWGLVGGRS